MLPSSEVDPKKTTNERDIGRQLGKVCRYLAKSTNANMRNFWEGRITILKRSQAVLRSPTQGARWYCDGIDDATK